MPIESDEHLSEASLCPDYVIYPQKFNCACGLMYLDVLYSGFRHGTDVDRVARDIVSKSAVITLGSIPDVVLRMPDEGIFDSNGGVKPGFDRAK